MSPLKAISRRFGVRLGSVSLGLLFAVSLNDAMLRISRSNTWARTSAGMSEGLLGAAGVVVAVFRVVLVAASSFAMVVVSAVVEPPLHALSERATARTPPIRKRDCGMFCIHQRCLCRRYRARSAGLISAHKQGVRPSL